MFENNRFYWVYVVSPLAISPTFEMTRKPRKFCGIISEKLEIIPQNFRGFIANSNSGLIAIFRGFRFILALSPQIKIE